jgi:hypothetical protein
MITMPSWSLLFLVAALALGVIALAAWVSGLNYVGFTATASICAIISCVFSVCDVHKAK